MIQPLKCDYCGSFLFMHTRGNCKELQEHLESEEEE